MKIIDPSAPPEIRSLLIHGLNNVGKSHILGSICSYEKQHGKVVYVAVSGEPYETVFAHDMATVQMVEIEKIEDIVELVKQVGHVNTICLDSVQRLGELAGSKVTGDKYIIGSKEDHGRDWNKLKGEVFRALMALQQHCDLLVAVCPTELHEHPITKTVRGIPSCTGIGEKLVGRFNFVGYLTATTISPTVVTRTVDFQPRVDIVTRWNAKKALTETVKVPMGLNCWVPIKVAIEKGLDGE